MTDTFLNKTRIRVEFVCVSSVLGIAWMTLQGGVGLRRGWITLPQAVVGGHRPLLPLTCDPLSVFPRVSLNTVGSCDSAQLGFVLIKPLNCG